MLHFPFKLFAKKNDFAQTYMSKTSLKDVCLFVFLMVRKQKYFMDLYYFLFLGLSCNVGGEIGPGETTPFN
jgi:hypothetical protein